jgi:hypothetical protein
MSSEYSFSSQPYRTCDQQTDFGRRLIGRRFEDETVTKDIKSWPFKVIDNNGSPMVEVEYLGEKKQFSPQEISAMVLVKVRSARTYPMWRGKYTRYVARQILTHPTDEGGC